MSGRPSIDQWLAEAKAAPEAENCGMYLTHCGTVRRSAKAKVRLGQADTRDVSGMRFSYDAEKVDYVYINVKTPDVMVGSGDKSHFAASVRCVR